VQSKQHSQGRREGGGGKRGGGQKEEEEEAQRSRRARSAILREGALALFSGGRARRRSRTSIHARRVRGE